MSETVLITGMAGFLGRHVARHFLREGWHVVGLDDVPPENAPSGNGLHFERMKLPDAAFADFLHRTQPRVCVHCAGRASVPLSMNDPVSDYRANAELTFELLEAFRHHARGCRFLLLSSAAVYGNPQSQPVAETAPLAPLSPYGYHKLQSELLCEEFAKIYDLRAASVRIFSAYGPGLRRQVIWDICQKVLTTGRLVLRGTGAESRDFIHASDIARALQVLAKSAPCRGEIYNLANGRETTIVELATLLLASLNSVAEPEFDGTSTPGQPLRWQADIAKIRALGFAPAIPLEAGLRTTASWCAAELTA